MTVTAQTLSSEEQEQLQQTIEMFEVIVQASPQDCQSLEILKDAYVRLGRMAEGMATATKLADTYRDLGEISQAFLQYEWLLQKDPSNPEVMVALGEMEEQLRQEQEARKGAKAAGRSPNGTSFDFSGINEGATLIATDQTQRQNARRESTLGNGDEALARFLIQKKIVAEDIVNASLERVTKRNNGRAAGSLGMSLLEEISQRGNMEMEPLLCGILDRSKFAYIPIEYYDVDRAVVKMLPEDLTVGRLIVPFDVMSRTLMVAMANPFDAEGKEMVQQLLDYNIQWHLASPAAISRVLADTYKLSNSLEGGLRLV